jgi:hypothetical protein
MELTTSYDKNADVLYVSLGKPRASETVEQPDGLLFRYADNKDRSPSGVTVPDYRTAWSDGHDKFRAVEAFDLAPQAEPRDIVHPFVQKAFRRARMRSAERRRH